MGHWTTPWPWPTSWPPSRRICLRSDRASALEQWGLSEAGALAAEVRHGMAPLRSGETLEGAARFASGAGRGGAGV